MKTESTKISSPSRAVAFPNAIFSAAKKIVAAAGFVALVPAAVSVAADEASDEIVIDSEDADYSLGSATANFDASLAQFSGTISGDGEIYSSADLEFSGDLEAFSGTTFVSAGTFTATDSAELGSGEISVASGATLALAFADSAKTVANATSGAGTILVASGTASFSEDVGVKNLTVAEGATLSGSVRLSQEDAILTISGTVSLDAAEGETIFGDDLSVYLASTATLSLANASSVLKAGNTITIFGGDDVHLYSATSDSTLESVVESFLLSDSGLASFAKSNALIYTIDDDDGLFIASASTTMSQIGVHDGAGTLYRAIIGNSLTVSGVKGLFTVEEYRAAAAAATSDALVRAMLSGDAAAVFETFSPLSYASLTAVPTVAFQNDVRAILAHLDLHRYETFNPEKNWDFYAQAQYSDVENDDARDTPTFDFDLAGALAGADCRLSRTTLVGVAVAAGTGDIDVHHGGGKIDVNDARATAYVSKLLAERVTFDFGAQFGYADYDIKRKTAYGNVDGETDAWNLGIFVNLGTQLTISQEYGIFAEPYVGVAFTYAAVSGFTEEGDGGYFDVDDFESESVAASVGCNFAWEFELAGTRSRLGFGVAYTCDFCGDEVDIDASVIGDEEGTLYRTTADMLASDRFSFGPTIDIGVTESLGVYASYVFDVGLDSSSVQSANVGVRAWF